MGDAGSAVPAEPAAAQPRVTLLGAQKPPGHSRLSREGDALQEAQRDPAAPREPGQAWQPGLRAGVIVPGC